MFAVISTIWRNGWLALGTLAVLGLTAPALAQDAGDDDAGEDSGFDAGPDSGFDAGPDSGFDAGPDGGPDAGDAGDAGDASTDDDAGDDAGDGPTPRPDATVDVNTGGIPGVAGNGCSVGGARTSLMGAEVGLLGFGLLWLFGRRRRRLSA